MAQMHKHANVVNVVVTGSEFNSHSEIFIIFISQFKIESEIKSLTKYKMFHNIKLCYVSDIGIT